MALPLGVFFLYYKDAINWISNIEVEQSILTVSTERLGTWHEEQEW